jgi:hypothetical protein
MTSTEAIVKRPRGGQRKHPLMADFLRLHEKNAGCWEYPGARQKGGYARYCESRERKWAHRVAFRIAKGEIPAGLHVCHSCDNPPCCRPSHLFAATNEENRADSVAKRRHNYGERNGSSKLAPSQVLAIRADTRSDADIAWGYGVSRSTVSEIQSGKKWRRPMSEQPR